ncbi:MAG: hypothetical protein KF865_11755 [Bdellovibrionaceae bacterium]|nr:hypothetical protein [Pseudobdellovibrionaceae bacterium]
MALLIPVWVHAGSVRTIGVNNDSMTPIYLRLGKSTVLRFPDKPRKVVVGNQNYYGLEFIENDLAIQPLGAVSTNLFVYTERRTYGFILTPGERYDDLVFVRWKSDVEKAQAREAAQPVRESRPNLSFKIGKQLKVTIEKVKAQPALGLHLVDSVVENTGKAEAALAGFTIRAMRQGKALDKQESAMEKDRLKPGEKTKVRLVLRLDQKTDFTLESKFNGETGKAILGRKFL